MAYSILNIRPLNLVLIERNQQLHSGPDPNIGTTTRQPLIMAANGGFVHKANCSIDSSKVR